MRAAQVNIAIRWFAGYALHEKLPDHSSLTRIRQRWGEERFRKIFKRTVKACLNAKIATAEVVERQVQEGFQAVRQIGCTLLSRLPKMRRAAK